MWGQWGQWGGYSDDWGGYSSQQSWKGGGKQAAPQGKGKAGGKKGPSEKARLFLGGISAQTLREHIIEHFEKYGPVVDAMAVFKDGKHRGFGFVTFKEQESADAAFAEQQLLDGRIVDVKKCVPRDEAPPPAPMPAHKIMPETCKLFLGGLPQSITKAMIQQHFAKYGKVLDCVVMVDGDGNSRGFGFVTYDNEQSPKLALMDGDHILDDKRIEVRQALPAGVDPKTGLMAAPENGMGLMQKIQEMTQKLKDRQSSGGVDSLADLGEMMQAIQQMQGMLASLQSGKGAMGVQNVLQHLQGTKTHSGIVPNASALANVEPWAGAAGPSGAGWAPPALPALPAKSSGKGGYAPY
eukprot:gnl/TRDRNA2_/TRDRNA2_93611_c0_seq1.p1 gnl/TRDRNA2_/TRDRNA2_93611_c0~~gnl/TRDRNA2_/TRDRNA2_93611_c0_seq1.p1  ORF type:complete len:352 (+),score=54.90 gnl/TRDRNA2_/TRDRNA2_93611_c0_seq1:55-1110(+)